MSYLEPNGKNRPHETCSVPYGAAANIHEQKLCSTGKIVQKKPVVTLVDRKCNTEAYFLSFIWANNLPIYLAPKLLQLCKDVSIDNKALNEVNFSRTSATYKIVDGLAISKNKSVIHKMQNSHFSVNIDECTASSAMKVLSILASSFDDEMSRCVIEHYKSLECAHVNAEVLFSKICNVFSEDEIPLEDLISNLSDSAGYMRGEKSGIGKKLELFKLKAGLILAAYCVQYLHAMPFL